jgi:hypothetical protein
VPSLPAVYNPDSPRLIVRVFPKNKFGHVKMAELRRMLPADVDVKSGTSAIDLSAPVDILLINSRIIRPADILLVLEAFERIGSPMKSVQSGRIKANPEIQAGTIVDGETEILSFKDSSPLGLSQLRQLVGKPDAFWKVARNEQCFKNDGQGNIVDC